MNFREWIYWVFAGRSYRRLYKLVNQGFAQLKSGDYHAARMSFTQALEFREYMVGNKLLDYILVSLSNTWIFTDEYEGGIAYFSEYIRRYPSDAMAYCQRACGLWYSDRLQEAINDYTRSLELKPGEIQAFSNRAQVLVEMGNYAQALEEIDHALRVLTGRSSTNPTEAEWHSHSSAFLHRARGAALAGVHDIDAAMDEFNISISMSPENAWVYYSRAEAHERTGNGKSALADYRLALQKKSPSLNINRRKRAETRISELDSTSV